MSRKSKHFSALYTDQSCGSKNHRNYRTDKKDRTNIMGGYKERLKSRIAFYDETGETIKTRLNQQKNYSEIVLNKHFFFFSDKNPPSKAIDLAWRHYTEITDFLKFLRSGTFEI